MMGKPVIRAIMKRDLRSWFTSPTGYVFITVFVLLCAFAQFVPPRFFQENTASLASLAQWFRYLLLFFIPAITMLVWAGERSRGTDEILLTLPASDFKIVMGKFLAAAGIYTISLIFTLLLAFWLDLLGDPDWGLILSSYLAFWCLGVFLVSVGMVGSQITDNLTVAFILGAVFCAVVVFAEEVLALVFPEIWRGAYGYGPVGFFDEMVRGLVSFKSIAFFAGGTAAFLYLNLLLLSRGRWWKPTQGLHLAARCVALFVGFVALTILVGRWGARADFTSESLHSLSKQSLDALESLRKRKDAAPVNIRAWISPEVPRDYVPTRRELINLLREYDARGGASVEVELIETERFSDEARDAEANFGVTHETRFAEEGSRRREFDLFLAVALTCGPKETVIPFLDKGLSVEYELTRSIRVVSGAKRAKLGVLSGDKTLNMFAGFDPQIMTDRPDWEIIRELKLQYEVVKVEPNEDYPPDLDVLVGVMPSALTQAQMDRLLLAIQTGTPALLFDDPFPNVAPHLAPSAPKPGDRNPMTGRQERATEPKGDVRGLLRNLGIDWDPQLIAWQSYNPHPSIEVPQEFVFVSTGSGAFAPFNPGDEVSAGLQELLFWVGGTVREPLWGGEQDWVLRWFEGCFRPFGDWVFEALGPEKGSRHRFVPLLTTGRQAGAIPEFMVFRRDYFGRQELNPERPHVPKGEELILACRVEGFPPAPPDRKPPGGAEAPPPVTPEEEKEAIHVVFVADMDLVNLPVLWQFRRQGNEEFQFDNVAFVLNCVDSLVGDESFIRLRSRRPRDRTLTTIEMKEAKFREGWLKEKRTAEKAAETQLNQARDVLKERLEAIDAENIDERAKEIRKGEVESVENRRLEVTSAAIERRKKQTIDQARGTLNRDVEKIQNNFRILAICLSPVPAIIVGIIMFTLRRRKERISIPEIRSVRGGAR